MPYTLGIKIDGTRITDDDAKIIALSIMGLAYADIYKVTFINVHCISNKVSALYGLFGITKNICELIVMGELNGFSHYCYVNGIDILDKEERRRLQELRPRLLRESKRLDLNVTTL